MRTGKASKSKAARALALVRGGMKPVAAARSVGMDVSNLYRGRQLSTLLESRLIRSGEMATVHVPAGNREGADIVLDVLVPVACSQARQMRVVDRGNRIEILLTKVRRTK